MAKVVMMCGKICSGKSTYAEKLRKEINAAVLSVDEIMLALFGQDAGDNHDRYVECLKKYIFDKSLEIIEIGTSVILDLGLWKKAERENAKAYYNSRGIKNEIHYIDISDDEWTERIALRNKMILSGQSSAYIIDEGLAEKANTLFETPDKNEIDVWINCEKSG